MQSRSLKLILYYCCNEWLLFQLGGVEQQTVRGTRQELQFKLTAKMG